MEKKLIYIGPSKPFGLPLKAGAILDGDPADIIPGAADALKKNPGFRQLFQPICEYPRARRQLEIPGSNLSGIYSAVKAASKEAL